MDDYIPFNLCFKSWVPRKKWCDMSVRSKPKNGYISDTYYFRIFKSVDFWRSEAKKLFWHKSKRFQKCLPNIVIIAVRILHGHTALIYQTPAKSSAINPLQKIWISNNCSIPTIQRVTTRKSDNNCFLLLKKYMKHLHKPIRYCRICEYGRHIFIQT